ncbi:adenosylcobinamide-phosphate synthase CbiB [Candidatus Contubernalis alkaliaceticus]|uniref:adenosylcobinamide-phosphate synthase CbiB n=1 Tax=Candidatus Contubernalis alkaliaceticus TaxID=338645 RepID=UPI001F4BF4A1|nr:adenosylcobinamide-phosphate synthase CbiB [Candidatus Contubernalis alkalaceticus]UNC92490.1 cobalamin biosynthesis protein CobD [Candidatus Contubernalis alkalaceticus]
MELLIIAYCVDLVVGDPRWIPHPVVIIGKFIIFLENKLYNENLSPRILYYRGFLLALVVMIFTLGSIGVILCTSRFIDPYLYSLVYIWFLASTLAVKGLGQAGLDILKSLEKNSIQNARKKTGEIVGRDTENLSEIEVARAAVETVAENTVDGVTAPLFYALLGGLPLALLYKAINTMDSMIGYNNQRYAYFGRFAAKLDDLVNYIPARLTAMFMLFCSLLLRYNWKRGWKVLLTDSRNHPSPNSGYSEAVTAGVLGIQLGGTNFYLGVPSKRPVIGIKTRDIEPRDILYSVRLMYLTSFITLAVGIIIKILIN